MINVATNRRENIEGGVGVTGIVQLCLKPASGEAINPTGSEAIYQTGSEAIYQTKSVALRQRDWRS